MSKHLIMGTAGHVDHGKTALISALTGIDCDTHKEEKERGITINLGFAHLELNSGISLGIVDVPGHKDFIKTMVAGVYGIDFVLLVIAADSGIMPQTREHFNIMRMLGVTKGLVVITKSDLADEEMMELVNLEVMEFLEDTPLENAPIIAVSSITGDGIEKLKKEIEKAADEVSEKSYNENFRLYIDRIFNVKGQGIVVTGSVLGGQVVVGQELFLLPGFHDKIRIKSIQRHGKTVNSTMAGDRAALNLAGLKFDDFERGMILTDKIMTETGMLDAQVELFDGLIRLKAWSHIIFHTGTFSTAARMHLLTVESLSGAENAVVQIHLEKPAILLNNDKFIIRNSSNTATLGGGTVLDTQPLHHRRRTEKLKEKMQLLSDAMMNMANRFQLIMLEMGKEDKPVSMENIAGKTGLAIDEIETAVAESAGKIRSHQTSEGVFLVSESYQNKIQNKILVELAAWHEQNKLVEKGLDVKELKGKLSMNSVSEIEILQKLLNNMLDEGKIKLVGTTFAIKNHEVKPDKKMQQQLDWLNNQIRNIGLQRLTLSELELKAQNEGIKKGHLKMLLQFMAGRVEIYFNGEDILHAAAVEIARKKLLTDLSAKPKGINEKEFRELIDAPKKTVQVLIDIFVNEQLITKDTFYLNITEKGRVHYNS